MYFLLKTMFPRGEKFVTTRGNKKNGILQVLRNKMKETERPYPSSAFDMVDEYAGWATRN